MGKDQSRVVTSVPVPVDTSPCETGEEAGKTVCVNPAGCKDLCSLCQRVHSHPSAVMCDSDGKGNDDLP